MNAYVWKAHCYAREGTALTEYRAARMRAVRRGFLGTWDDPYLRDAIVARIRWQAYRELNRGVLRSIAALERAEAAA